MTTKIVSFFSPKGGVGKTTSCANLGALLADLEQKVLLIDADSQNSLSGYFNITHKKPGGILNVIVNNSVSQDDISNTDIKNLDIITSNDGDGLKVPNLVQSEYLKEHKLSNILRNADLDYDYIFIDTQGATGFLQDFGIIPADILISPLEPTKLSVRSFIQRIESFIKRYEIDPEGRLNKVPVYVLINKSNNYKIAREIEQHMENLPLQISSRIHFLKNRIPNAVIYQESAALGTPAHRLEKSRNKGKMKSASAAIHHVVWEIFPQLKNVAVLGSDANNVEEDQYISQGVSDE